MDIQETIAAQVKDNAVVLYMKGTPKFPQCGFSSLAVEILKRCGVEDYLSVNVLEDPDIRQGIKDYTNWPTVPQLYVQGEFIGGADILREMYNNGELQTTLAPVASAPPEEPPSPPHPCRYPLAHWASAPPEAPPTPPDEQDEQG